MVSKITLSGFAGTGKSTIGKLLADELSFKFISVGNYSRKFALEEYGMTINEFQGLLLEKPELDNIIDSKFKDYCQNNDSLVIDYRLGFHFVKNAFNVLLMVCDEESVRRVSLSKRNDEDISRSAIENRNKQMKERFINNYGVDFTDESNYDIVIDTSLISASDVVSKIMIEIKSLVYS